VTNLAVQEVLKTLKAVPADETEVYQIVYQDAIFPTTKFNKGDVVSVLYKLQQYIYIFRNQYTWRVVL
jgi:hypothetical protein